MVLQKAAGAASVAKAAAAKAAAAAPAAQCRGKAAAEALLRRLLLRRLLQRLHPLPAAEARRRQKRQPLRRGRKVNAYQAVARRLRRGRAGWGVLN